MPETLVTRRLKLNQELRQVEERVDALEREGHFIGPHLVGILKRAAALDLDGDGPFDLQHAGPHQDEHLLHQVSKPEFVELLYRAAISAYWEVSVS